MNLDSSLKQLSVGRTRVTSLEELYADFGPRAGRLAYLLVGDPTTAQDIAQEAFLRISPRLPWLRDPHKAEFYLRTTVINLCKKHWRRRGKESLRGTIDPSLRVLQDHAPQVAQRDELVAALHELPMRQRSAVALRYFEDLSEAQTADLLGCPIGTVKSTVARALEALREELGGQPHG